jgi:uncharacterized protein YndB with AHSA1/START domain
MTRPETGADVTLHLRRTYPTSRQTLFDAFTRADEIAQWFNPDPQCHSVVHALEARPGGRYRIEMVMPGDRRHTVAGTYREVRAPERLVFTWAWEEPGATETIVTIDLHERGDSTELVLTHERFTTTEERDNHRRGWVGGLEHLALHLDTRRTS